MYLAIIILPLLVSILSGFFGRKVGVTGSHITACSGVLLTTFLAVLAFFEVGLNNKSLTIEWFRWIDTELFNVWWAFYYDSLTVSMFLPVLIVSSLVHLYSIDYMKQDPHNQRFFSYLGLFTFMMIILTSANNYLLMFVGWEGVGICSYLLVSFWFTRIWANLSALSAFLTNRVGDWFLTIGMILILCSMGNLDYATVFSLAPYMNKDLITIIGICLLIGAMAKSSQVGLHVWLPMAMEGPTPVSALIHAATMVTAGVYLLMRSSPLLEYSSMVLIICLWLGAITTVFSSLVGLFQQDIKKVIAYSTMSQLGMMVIAVGLSCYNIALFHLVNHAFYKALLFLGAGSVIHAVSDNQDFRKYGGLRPFLPLTYSVMLIASLSLVAFPFMTGFYSKDLILESAYGQYYFSSTVVYVIATIGAIFTTLYSVKVLYLTFLTNPNGPLINYKGAHEGSIFMSLPLMILAVFSIFFGFISKDMFIGLGTEFFSDNSLFIHPYHEIMLDTEFGVPSLFKLLPLIFTILFSVVSITFSEYLSNIIVHFKLSRLGYNIFSFFNQRFLIELFYNRFITGLVLMLGGQTSKILDKGSIEYLGPYGLEKGLWNISNNIAKLNTGAITTYSLYILVSLVFYMSFYLYIKGAVIIILLLAGLSKFKDNFVLGFELDLHNAPRPHSFTSVPLTSSGIGGNSGMGSNSGGNDGFDRKRSLEDSDDDGDRKRQAVDSDGDTNVDSPNHTNGTNGTNGTYNTNGTNGTNGTYNTNGTNVPNSQEYRDQGSLESFAIRVRKELDEKDNHEDRKKAFEELCTEEVNDWSKVKNEIKDCADQIERNINSDNNISDNDRRSALDANRQNAEQEYRDNDEAHVKKKSILDEEYEASCLEADEDVTTPESTNSESTSSELGDSDTENRNYIIPIITPLCKIHIDFISGFYKFISYFKFLLPCLELFLPLIGVFLSLGLIEIPEFIKVMFSDDWCNLIKPIVFVFSSYSLVKRFVRYYSLYKQILNYIDNCCFYKRILFVVATIIFLIVVIYLVYSSYIFRV